MSMTPRTGATAIFLAFAASPTLAFASTTTDLVSQLAGLFYIIVGLAVAASVLLMGGGFIMWIARLGTWPTYRDDAIRLMEWGVATLFTLIVVLGIVEFIQTHTSLTLYIVSVVVIVLVIWIIITSGLLSEGFGGGKKEEEE